MEIGFSLKILIVDDSLFSREWLIDKLPETIRKRSTILQASGGQEGLEITFRENPDILFLDLTMPEFSGFDVLEALKKESHETAIVVVSADRQRSTEEKVRALGASEVLHKPVDPDSLKHIFFTLAFGSGQ